jgi:DNA polymerase (family 10)
MTKAEIAAVLEEIGTLLELKGENPFKIRAYANAARSIDAWGGSLSDLQDEEALAKIPGVGKAIAAKIKELATTGSLKYVEELRGEFPPAILELFSISGLGAKKIKALYDKLHVTSIAELLKACESGRVAELPGFGEMTQEKLCKAIADRVKHSGSFQFGKVANEAESLRNDFASHPEVLQVCIADYRLARNCVIQRLWRFVLLEPP